MTPFNYPLNNNSNFDPTSFFHMQPPMAASSNDNNHLTSLLPTKDENNYLSSLLPIKYDNEEY